jgi:hypothetical protein
MFLGTCDSFIKKVSQVPIIMVLRLLYAPSATFSAEKYDV